ncbi:MAG: hypothetical protein HYW63_04350 [Candidatus Levybacteria bacterium]|nr:hypothetical protein [Candidatus Levybacteria bacterium]
MSNKKKSLKDFRLIILITAVAAVLIWIFLQPNFFEVGKGSSTFESKYLNFSLSLPSGFQAKDETSRIIINSDDGQITVNRNGTQFNNLEDYISDFDSKRNLISSETNNTSINGHEALSRLVEYPDQNYSQKSYYIYVEKAVYIFSTTSESLYDELDQIAQSFKYTGE